MRIILKESQYTKLKSGNIIITEDVDLDGYDDSDFVEVAMLHFRKWVNENHGEDVGRYPFKLLASKYLDEFRNTLNMRSTYRYGGLLQKFEEIGREIVLSGKHTLTSLRSEKKFIEQHSRGLNIMLKTLKIPSFIKVNFIEDEPYNLNVELVIDFGELAKSKDYEYPSGEISRTSSKIRDFITQTMGVEIGTPVEGKLRLSIYNKIDESPEFINLFKKTLKKEFKSYSSDIRGFKMETTRHNKFLIKILFTRNSGWGVKGKVRDAIANRIKELGYNINAFEIDY